MIQNKNGGIVNSSDPAVSSSIFVGAEREENLIKNVGTFWLSNTWQPRHFLQVVINEFYLPHIGQQIVSVTVISATRYIR